MRCRADRRPKGRAARPRAGLAGALAGLATLAPACAFEPGDPWGEVRVTLDATFDPPSGRLTEDGRLKTTTNHEVAIDALEVRLGAITLALAGEGAAGFDPANPPPGYSLCHNGHCHHDSGALVDYEDIAAELALGGGGQNLVVSVASDALALDAGLTEVTLGQCVDTGCQLPTGRMVTASVALAEVHLVGTVYGPSVPDDGLPVDVVWPLDVPVDAEAEARFDGSSDPGLDLGLSLRFPPHFVDGTSWDPLPSADLVAENLTTHAELGVTQERYDP